MLVLTLFLKFLVFFLAPVTPKWDFGSVSIILDLFWIHFGAAWSSLEQFWHQLNLFFL